MQLNQPKYREIRPEVIIYGGEEAFDASKYVRSVSTESSIDTKVSTARVSFVPVNNENLNYSINTVMHLLKTKIKKYCLISIKIDRTQIEHNFYGIIDQTFESVSTNNNSTGRTWIANCSLALPKILSKDSLPNSPILQNDPRVTKELGAVRTEFFTWLRGYGKGTDAIATFANKSPETPIKLILKTSPSTQNFNKVFNFNVDTWDNMFDKKEIDTDKKIIDINFLITDMLFDPSLSTYNGTVLNYIEACIDADFYEFFFESATSKEDVYEGMKVESAPTNKMTIRTKPYSYKDMEYGDSKLLSQGWLYWEDLDTIEFESKYRLSENLGTNDFEIANFFSTTYENSLIASPQSEAGLFGTYYPVMDFELIKKYGVREHRAVTKYLDTIEIAKGAEPYTYKEEDSNRFYKSLMIKRDKQIDWYLFPDFESGQITAIGNSQYKIGRKLVYTDKMYFDYEGLFGLKEPTTGMEYYINRVDHNFEYPSTYTTTIGVTRGQPIRGGYQKDGKNKSMVIDWLQKRRDQLYKINHVKKGTVKVSAPLTDEEIKKLDDLPAVE